jgi:hypothetical protein
LEELPKGGLSRFFFPRDDCLEELALAHS